MGTFRSLFGKSKNTNTTTKSKISNPIPIEAGLQSRSYDSAVALAPPVKGAYPVAGNGANVLDEIQRTRAKRQSQAGSIAPNTPRRRDDIPSVPVPTRPQTAPHDGTPSGGHTHGRTRSGFSMKSPPSFFSSSRRNSLSRNNSLKPSPPMEKDTPAVLTPTPPPQVSSPPPTRGRGREPTYQPPLGNDSIPEGFTPPFAHNRSQSQASHKSHVDLLDAHSTIKNSREQSQHRAKASGFRNYGEDVADRNIAAFSSEHRMDLNSPEFSYLKQVYNSHIRSNIGRDSPGRDRPGRDSPTRERLGRESPATSRDSPSRDSPTIGTAAHPKMSPVAVPRVVSQSQPGSAAGRVPRNNDTTSDDTAPARAVAPNTTTRTTTTTTTTTTSTRVPPIRHLRTSSMRSNASRLFQSRPATAIPPRTDSATTRAYSANRGRNDAGSPSPNGSHEQNVRPMSPLSTTSSIDHEPPTRNPRRPSLASSIAGSTSSRTEKSVSFRDPPPVALHSQFRVASPTLSSTSSTRVTSPSHSRQTSNTSVTRGPSLASRRQRTASMSSQNTVVPQGHGRAGSKNNSISYGPPSVAGPPSPKSPRSKANRESYLVQRSSNPISLEGVVDLSNTVDTEVITKSLPGTYKPSTSSPNRRSLSLPEHHASSSPRVHMFSPLNISPHHSSRNSSQGSLPSENWSLPHSASLTPSESISKTLANGTA
ncbi:hypothetical protein B0J14DRAFT_284137 [Halenospora varia]|nr:hypothetical protein B0J14DRAFT_284137 [Halenospora varia]